MEAEPQIPHYLQLCKATADIFHINNTEMAPLESFEPLVFSFKSPALFHLYPCVGTENDNGHELETNSENSTCESLNMKTKLKLGGRKSRSCHFCLHPTADLLTRYVKMLIRYWLMWAITLTGLLFLLHAPAKKKKKTSLHTYTNTQLHSKVIGHLKLFSSRANNQVVCPCVCS